MADYAMPGLSDFTKLISGTTTKYKKKQAEYEPTVRRSKKRRRVPRGSSSALSSGRVTAAEAKKVRSEPIGEKVAAATLEQLAKLPGTRQGAKVLAALRAAPLTGGTAALAIAAGLAAYGLTSAVVAKLKQKKEGLRELAFDAAQAYRLARVKAAETKGAALTRPELDALARRFKDELAKLGLTTKDLSALGQSFLEKGGF